MKFLAIDRGNSSTKAWVLDTSGLMNPVVVDTLRVSNDDWSPLEAFISRHNPDRGAVCSVAAPCSAFDSDLDRWMSGRMPERIRGRMSGGMLHLDAGSPVPLGVAGYDRRALGLDRLCAAVGATALFQKERMLVVDSGTAVTLDLVENGRFLGGNISPGLRLRLHSLAEAGARLPEVAPDSLTADIIGTDTRSAIVSGCLAGICYEIIGLSQALAGDGQLPLLILCGGDSRLLARTLEDIPGFASKCHVIPHLVALGLLYISNYNVDNE